MRNLFYLFRIFEIGGRLISKMGAWILVPTAIAGALVWANVTFAGVMLEDWPDAISCESTTPQEAVYYLSDFPGGTTDVAYANPNEVLFFSTIDRLLQNTPTQCVANEDSIDDSLVFTQFDFGSSESPSGGATTTQSVIHNPTLDMFLGFVTFFAIFWFTVWFFRRPYDTY